MNEQATIGPLVAEIRQFLTKVIVVDDGSQDATAAKAEAAGADVIKFPVSNGKGMALQTGWRRASELGFSWALNMDGDGQHAPADIPRFFAKRDCQKPALIVGNRMHHPSAMPWLRRTVNRWMSARLSKAARLSLPDSQCGFRLMHLPTWRRLDLRAQRFEIESEMLLRFVRLGVPVEFVPIQVIYRGHSNINPFTDTVRWLRWFFFSSQL